MTRTLVVWGSRHDWYDGAYQVLAELELLSNYS
jgi:hypothetical protein